MSVNHVQLWTEAVSSINVGINTKFCKYLFIQSCVTAGSAADEHLLYYKSHIKLFVLDDSAQVFWLLCLNNFNFKYFWLGLKNISV
jgi:hypothetical protein